MICGNVGIGTTSPGGTLDIHSGTQTTSVPALNITQTWNNGSTTFDAPIFENITSTASGGNSKLMDLQVGGASEFNVIESGHANAGQLIASPEEPATATITLITTLVQVMGR
jgi:hypothetical protein